DLMGNLPARVCALVVASCALLAACTGQPALTDAAAPPVDAPVTCRDETDCDDGLFCNGPERCRPRDPDADPYGCVPAASPCGEAALCNETADTCVADCTDADGDGAAALDCGGDDCDDADPTRYPGAPEVCDA